MEGAPILRVPVPRVDDFPAGRLRILHVISGLTAGGAETVLFRLIRQARHIDHEVICLGARDWYSDKLEQCGVPVHHIHFASLGKSVAGALRLYQLIKSSRADVVQGWMYRGNILGGIPGRLVGKPVIWNIRCTDFDQLPLRSRLIAYLGAVLAHLVPTAVLNCSGASRELHTRIGYGAVPDAVIPNGYDATHFRPDDCLRTSQRKALGIDEGTFLIGTIGRWNSAKGYDVLLSALERLRERGIAFRLIMAGIGLDDTNATLGKMIGDRGCTDVVQRLGYQPDIRKVACALDLHVLPSLSEGFPNVVAETMLCGVANVSTDVGDAGLIVADTGWVIPPSDADRLATAIDAAHHEWACRPEDWRARRIAARQRIADKFSLDSMAAAYENIWSAVAADAKKPRKVAVRRLERKLRPLRASPDQHRLRILHIINDLGAGGAETLLYRLVSSERANDHVVVSLGRRAWYSSLLEARGVIVHHLGMHSPAAIFPAALRLTRLIRESQADVVQCWMYRANLIGGVVAKAMAKPVVWGIHCSSVELLRPASRALARLGGVLARWTPDYVINCSTCSAEIHGKLGYSRGRGGVIHNGYDPKQFYRDDAARVQTRKELGIGPETFLIGSVSRWHVQKNIPNLLAAVKLAHNAGVPLKCLLIGHELHAQNAGLMASIHETGCDSLAVPLWIRSDVPDLARALDLHALSSCTEAFPNVIAETMLSGTPGVVTDVGDCAVMVGDTGWVVQKDDPEQLAGAIIRAYSEFRHQPHAWQQRREAARNRIVDNFGQDRMFAEYGRIWHELARSAKGAWRRQAAMSPEEMYAREDRAP